MGRYFWIYFAAAMFMHLMDTASAVERRLAPNEYSLWPRFTAIGMLVYSKPSTTAKGISFNRGFAYGAGGAIEFPLNPTLSIETGALYSPRTFRQTYAGKATQVSGRLLMAPLLIRIWFFRSITFGAGVYGAYGFGDLQLERDGLTAPLSYSEAGLRRHDLGFMGIAGINLGLFKDLAIAFEGRYAYAMTNSAVKGSYYFDDIQGIVGIRIGRPPSRPVLILSLGRYVYM